MPDPLPSALGLCCFSACRSHGLCCFSAFRSHGLFCFPQSRAVLLFCFPQSRAVLLFCLPQSRAVLLFCLPQSRPVLLFCLPQSRAAVSPPPPTPGRPQDGIDPLEALMSSWHVPAGPSHDVVFDARMAKEEQEIETMLAKAQADT